MKKFSLFLFSVLIPASIIAASIMTWGRNIAFNLAYQAVSIVGGYSIEIFGESGVVQVNKPEPSVPWLILFSFFIGYVLINHYLIKPYIKNSITKMSFEERKKSLLLLADEFIRTIINWVIIYAALDNLGAAYPTNYFFQSGLNWVMISVVIGAALKVSETIRYIFKK